LLSAKKRQHRKEREMAIQSFDKRTVGEVLNACKEALELVAEDFGLVLERKYCTYAQNEMPVAFKLIAPERTEDGETVDPKETEFRKYAARFGLQPDDYGKMFKTYNGVFRICGIKPRSRKYSVLGESTTNGKVYKFREQAVKDGLEKEGA
jgi:hypothetical protein